MMGFFGAAHSFSPYPNRKHVLAADAVFRILMNAAGRTQVQ